MGMTSFGHYINVAPLQLLENIHGTFTGQLENQNSSLTQSAYTPSIQCPGISNSTTGFWPKTVSCSTRP